MAAPLYTCPPPVCSETAVRSKCVWVRVSWTLQVKNSLRAVNDRFEDSDDIPPPVRVIVAEGDEDVTIKVLIHHTAARELHAVS